MRKSLRLTALASIAALMVAACGAGATPTPAPTAAPTEAAATAAPTEAASEAPALDPNGLLAKILADKKIRISTDPNYAPYSFYDTATGKYTGFDTATAEEVVTRLNKELLSNIALEWVTPNWDLITAGSWGGRWDLSIGSMSITKGREKVVDFADPYYFDYGSIAVDAGSTITSVAELDGKSICVGAATTYEQWLQGTLEISDPNMAPPPAGAKYWNGPTLHVPAQVGRVAPVMSVVKVAERSVAPVLRYVAAPDTSARSMQSIGRPAAAAASSRIFRKSGVPITSPALMRPAMIAASALCSSSNTRAGPVMTGFFSPVILATQPSGARLPFRIAR